MLCILDILKDKQVEFAKLQIIDFYFVFPHLAKDISLPRVTGSNDLRRIAKSFPLPYEKLPDTKSLFSEMGDFQIQAIHILRSKKVIIENDAGLVSKGEAFSTDVISNLVLDNKYITAPFFTTLVNVFYQIPLLGEDGLKKRTDLMEYRYDAA